MLRQSRYLFTCAPSPVLYGFYSSVSTLDQTILDLASRGCQGTAKDYAAWCQFHGAAADIAQIEQALERCVSSGTLQRHADIPREFHAAGPLTFPARIEYRVSGEVAASPIQMVRSCMEAFLRFHGAGEDNVIDISIATTEAMENAVKYSDHSPIHVCYWVEARIFHISITNRLSDVRLEQDIAAGKYTSTTTLMRGMMVMVKLFDEMDIQIREDEKIAVFKAHKTISA